MVQGDFFGKAGEWGIIYPGHIRKPDTPVIFIGSDERIFPCQVDVILYNHYVAGRKIEIDAPCSIAQDQGFNTQLLHDPYGESNLLGRISFIKMKPALHHQ
ncbi:MAG: hypothetical protein A2097_08170 [Desulfobacula sp. GWF2_41_7]|nr:MAG: hypothetical protein A2097_08170 [Desulfobacula sp. GWF2_41_7]